MKRLLVWLGVSCRPTPCQEHARVSSSISRLLMRVRELSGFFLLDAALTITGVEVGTDRRPMGCVAPRLPDGHQLTTVPEHEGSSWLRSARGSTGSPALAPTLLIGNGAEPRSRWPCPVPGTAVPCGQSAAGAAGAGRVRPSGGAGGGGASAQSAPAQGQAAVGAGGGEALHSPQWVHSELGETGPPSVRFWSGGRALVPVWGSEGRLACQCRSRTCAGARESLEY